MLSLLFPSPTMHLTRTRLFAFSSGIVALLFLGAGCKDAPPPEPDVPAAAQYDVRTATCETLAEARANVAAAHSASVQSANDTYTAAHAAFRDGLNECLAGIWKGGPCDKEYEATQAAYKNAWGDISNDQFYKEWKSAKANWDECYANRDQKYEEWSNNNQGKDKLCQEEFQAKSEAARGAHDAAMKAAKEKRDADMAFLDELEKECKKPKPTGATGGTAVSVGTGGTAGTTTGSAGGTATATRPVTPPNPNAPACQDAVAGENGTPRTGRATDFGPKDILVNLMTQIAEDVTGTPIPTGAINDQIFAGIVVTKIHARLIEMRMEEIDAITSGDRKAEIALRQKIARYERARDVWGKIAEGRPALPEVKKEVAALNSMPTGACKTDADCGTPVCCSGTEVGSWSCNVSTGACVAKKTACTDPKVCRGNPAQCSNPPQKVKAISVGGKFIPLTQVHSFTGDECDDEEHWHANAGGSAMATDGTRVAETQGECGYGKTSAVPVIEVEAPELHGEVRMNF